MSRYFVSFIEEAVLNPSYKGYKAGRVEIFPRDVNDPHLGKYAIEELRFLTDNMEDFEKFREKWDFEIINGSELGLIKKRLAKDFREDRN